METIGERLKRLRLLKNLTLQEVAETLGTSKGNISSYENNKFKPASDSIVELAKLFNVSTDYILTGKDYININSQDNNENRKSLSESELYILHLFRKLNEKNKIELEGHIEDKIIEQKQQNRKDMFVEKLEKNIIPV